MKGIKSKFIFLYNIVYKISFINYLMATWSVKNLVIVAYLNTKLPLNRISTEFDNVTYDPEQFPGLKLSLGENKPTFLVFNTGKLVVTGGKSVEDAINAIHEFRKMLKEKLNIEVQPKFEYDIQNIVANGNFKYKRINLAKLAEEDPNANYNPEQFPAVIYKMNLKDKNITFLIYSTGKFVCTGAKKPEQIEEAVNIMEKLLEKYAKE